MSASVVIADDEPTLRQLLTILLGREPQLAVIGQAADGQAALDLVDQLDPDLLLLDLSMPRLDGLEVLARLQGRTRPRVIVLTGYDDPTTHQTALDLGASAYVVKGRDFDSLLDILLAQ